MDELERISNKAIMASGKYCPRICMEGLSKTSVKVVGAPADI
jgi:hypothetical protein